MSEYFSDEEIQEEVNRWYDDIFGGISRYRQIENAWQSQGKYSEALQDEIQGFIFWATYHYLEQKQYYLQLGENDRLVVTTDLKGNIYTVDFQHRSDYDEWVSASNQNPDLLLKYAKVACLYEE